MLSQEQKRAAKKSTAYTAKYTPSSKLTMDLAPAGRLDVGGWGDDDEFDLLSGKRKDNFHAFQFHSY